MPSLRVEKGALTALIQTQTACMCIESVACAGHEDTIQYTTGNINSTVIMSGNGKKIGHLLSQNVIKDMNCAKEKPMILTVLGSYCACVVTDLIEILFIPSV